jgi:hypothetical protein
MESGNKKVHVKKRRHLRKKRAAASSPSDSENSGVGDAHGQDAATVKGVPLMKRRQGDMSMKFTTRKKDGQGEGKGFHTFASSGLDAKPQYLVNDATRALDMGEDTKNMHSNAVQEDIGEGTQNMYRGMKGYKDYRDGFRREDEKSTTGKSHGPSKPSAN